MYLCIQTSEERLNDTLQMLEELLPKSPPGVIQAKC